MVAGSLVTCSYHHEYYLAPVRRQTRMAESMRPHPEGVEMGQEDGRVLDHAEYTLIHAT